MAYIKDLLKQPIPSIKNTAIDTLEDSFTGKYKAFRTILFSDPPRAPDIDLLNY
jgi:hypothetical protein